MQNGSNSHVHWPNRVSVRACAVFQALTRWHCCFIHWATFLLWGSHFRFLVQSFIPDWNLMVVIWLMCIQLLVGCDDSAVSFAANRPLSHLLAHRQVVALKGCSRYIYPCKTFVTPGGGGQLKSPWRWIKSLKFEICQFCFVNDRFYSTSTQDWTTLKTSGIKQWFDE